MQIHCGHFNKTLDLYNRKFHLHLLYTKPKSSFFWMDFSNTNLLTSPLSSITFFISKSTWSNQWCPIIFLELFAHKSLNHWDCCNLYSYLWLLWRLYYFPSQCLWVTLPHTQWLTFRWPHRLFTLGLLRLVYAPSMTSSWTKLAVWIISAIKAIWCWDCDILSDVT